MNSCFEFRIYQPKKYLAAYLQAVWSASVPCNAQSVARWLHSDGSSGVLFNLNGPILVDGVKYSTGIFLLPISKQAHSVFLPAGAQLAGLRFHPAIAFGIWRKHYEKPTALKIENDFAATLQLVFNRLVATNGHNARITILYRWLSSTINFSNVAPDSLIEVLNIMRNNQELGQLCKPHISLSQRQLERQFKRWVNMTPKYYQRILRVKNSLNFLKHNPETDLAELALNHGFTDQAHMTREFKQIAKITPKRYGKLVANRYS